MGRGLEMRVLDGVNTCSLAVSGCASFYRGQLLWIRGWDCLWDLSLGRHTGDGKFDGETFWVGCGCFLLGGTREGKRKLQDTYCEVVLAGRREFLNSPWSDTCEVQVSTT